MKITHVLVVASFCYVAISCNTKSTIFELVAPERCNINFDNEIVENDSVNPFDVTNVYNGAGVGIGDFNKDGLPDIFFAGNQVPCKLYQNHGNLRFTDVTEAARVNGEGRWCRGVAVVDINNDGWEDIYVCTTIVSDSAKRQNLLYVNRGTGENGYPVFDEKSAEYGLNDDSYSTMAAFFDYDNDGDLDMYLTVNEILQDLNPSVYRPRVTDGSFPSTGRLFRNDWKPALKHPYFTNVTKEAGVTIEGYGHSASIADFNRDGWKDIFVANDFLANDLLYINNHDGTFTDKAASYFKHTSANGMGQDVIDINNDGLSDVIELDMDPEDNFRKKLLMSGYNYSNYQNNDIFGYQYQYVRNTLQLNLGPRIGHADSIGEPIFGEIGFYAGISSTDWSWAPLVQDFDNDGFRDLIVTNGFPKDLTDHDFIAFREKSFASMSKREVLDQIPKVKLTNYAFHNNGNLKFTDVSGDWGFMTPSFSNGAVYADLDNDGDLDLVMNNINDKAFIYQNNSRQIQKNNGHYLSVKLIGDSLNRHGFGAWIELYYADKQQVIEQSPYRGYLSSVQTDVHFGLGEIVKIDSIVVRWPDLKKQVLTNVGVDQSITVDYKDANQTYSWQVPRVSEKALFADISDTGKLSYRHRDIDFIDFNIQKLLPHKFSEYGPGLAVGDVNNDHLDDVLVGGSQGSRTVLLIQQPNGAFISKNISGDERSKNWEDIGVCLFDADGDGDLDAYTASGSYESGPNTDAYRDKLYINDGKGNFRVDPKALPVNVTSKSCVRPVDLDNDGDLDLFVAGRVYPWSYPKSVSSAIYRNDSGPGGLKFTDVTDSLAPDLKNVGMVCDGLWTDFDNDGWQDLIIAGEWMPLLFLKNQHGRLIDASATSGITKEKGWWNSITPGDFDNDGDMDYVVGNLGENSFYKASERFPVSIYANDFYKQGTLQCVVTEYLKDKVGGQLKEFTVHTRDDVVEQLPFIKKRFLTYKDFGKATFDKLFTPEELKNAIKLSANYFRSALIRNQGGSRFSIEPLPPSVQFSAANGMVADDFDGDGNLDICINTNDFGTDPANGRYDALNGLLLKGDGKGRFEPLSMLQSGINIPGNGKALVKLRDGKGNYLLAAGQNRGPLKLFQAKHSMQIVPLNTDDISATIIFTDGRRQKQEFPFGSSFLSQSGRFLSLGMKLRSIRVTTNKGLSREIRPQQ